MDQKYGCRKNLSMSIPVKLVLVKHQWWKFMGAGVVGSDRMPCTEAGISEIKRLSV
jgi:hypothetical protein